MGYGTREQWRAWRKTWLDKQKATGGCQDCAAPAATGKARCAECTENRRAYMKARAANPEIKLRIAAVQKRHKDKLRNQAVAILGSACVCCGETLTEFLTLDHKNDDGANHRKEKGSKAFGTGLYRLIIIDPVIRAMFQLLCWNCNCAKGIHGLCPHERLHATNTRALEEQPAS